MLSQRWRDRDMMHEGITKASRRKLKYHYLETQNFETQNSFKLMISVESRRKR